MSDTDPRRALPSMDTLLAEPRTLEWAAAFGRETVLSSLRRTLEAIRAKPPAQAGSLTDTILTLAESDLEARTRPSLGRVINGTGVVLHTNLGRSRLAEAAVEAQRRAAGYGNVEYSLETGERGSRYDHCGALLCELTGAEAAIVTNNNAAAVSLCVNEFALGRETIVSRGELVEIGGSFRIPDVVSRSGAVLREVGTTNRTRVEDYASAVTDRTGLLLRVHPSNYRVEGFAARPHLAALVALARKTGLPLVHDVGSGLLSPDLLPGFPEEPSVAESIAAGADVVTLSGDKILGGPQAGLIVGKGELIARLRRNPLLRAFRVDKTTLAALEATLMLYRDHDLAATTIPTLRMLREPAESVESRARQALALAETGPGDVSTGRTRAVVGGGAYPGFDLESAGWIVDCARVDVDADVLAAACRRGDPPLVGRVHEGKYLVDVRTILPGEEAEALGLLLRAITRARDS